MHFLGYYVAEGFRNGVNILFGLNRKEDAIVEEISSVLLRFGMKSSVRKSSSENAIVVQSTNTILAEWIERTFGKGARNKRLPPWLMTLPKTLQKEFLYGLWRGDGCLTHRNGYAVFEYVTSSKTLALQIVILLARLGILCQLRECQQKGFSKGKIFHIYVCGEYVKKISELLRWPYSERTRSKNWKKGYLNNKYLFIPIQKILKENMDTNVYNLEVENASAFLCEGAYIHNSFGYVVLESLALGTPVLATCLGAPSEIIEHGKSGFIVPNSVDAFSEALQRIDELKPEDARRRAEYFKKGKGAREFYTLYKKMLDGKWPIYYLPQKPSSFI
jgi:hypothetical protein